VTFKQSVLLTILLAASSALVWAGCVSDCKDDFDASVANCKLMYDEPDDADDLELCIQSARADYEACIEECKD
jgi:hypothetical protein